MNIASRKVPCTKSLMSDLPLQFLFLIVMVFTTVSIYAADPFHITIKNAEYDSTRNQLKVEVSLGSKGTRTVSLFNDRTNELLIRKSVRGKDVRFTVRKLTGNEVPCEVRAESEGLSDVSPVANSPADCGVAPPPANTAPECAILAPAGNVSIQLGDSVNFTGQASDADAGDTLTYAWDFGGGAAVSSTALSPGAITFDVAAGTFTTRFTVTDAAGASCSRQRQVEVVEPPPPVNTPPQCEILAPGSDVSIVLGDSVYFGGQASDPDAGDTLTYEWDFGGGADVRPTVLEPGPVTFDVTNGLFVAQFIVTDAAGARCTRQRMVAVGSPPGELPPKVGEQPAPGTPEAGDGDHVVLAFNDLGMHCADLGSYPFSILPPFNTLNAQVVRKGSTAANRPLIMNDTMVALQYSAASNKNDPVGADSINSTSQNYPPVPGTTAANAIIRKTDFWDPFDGASIVEILFPGLHPVPDEGLQTLANYEPGNAHGRYMPGIDDPYYNNDPQAFSGYEPSKTWFTAQGVPMTSIDDKGRFNSYPLMRVQAVDLVSGNVLATTDGVAPVSTEVDCRDCHALGEVGADALARAAGPDFVPAATSDRVDVEAAAKHNILSLHDYQHGTSFVTDNQPVLCASCHRSNALADVGGPGGVDGISSMSAVMHGFHGRLQVDESGQLIRDITGEPVLIDPPNMAGSELPLIPTGEGIPMEQNCFNCHPGKITQCFRGAMYTAGQKCDDCHGNMLAMGGEFPLLTTGEAREPWASEPKCSACHSGHGNDPVGNLAYDPNDPSATPLELASSRFAENPGTLYRNSLDNHAGIACEGCHGSPHAIWPNRDPNANDNVPAIQLQGHAGVIRECTVCHESNSFPYGTLNGPHGMHPVNEPTWIKSRSGRFHEDFVWSNGEDQCAACHGADHRGTRLSRVPVDRVLRDEEGVVRATVSAGDMITCGLCHSISKSFED
ncbi:MAG: PKD domain-containing protein [Lysobacterales bacterium]